MECPPAVLRPVGPWATKWPVCPWTLLLSGWLEELPGRKHVPITTAETRMSALGTCVPGSLCRVQCVHACVCTCSHTLHVHKRVPSHGAAGRADLF